MNDIVICKENCSRETGESSAWLCGHQVRQDGKQLRFTWLMFHSCVCVSVHTYINHIILLKRHLHDSLEKKEERVKNKQKLICKTHIAGDVGSSSAFYKEHTKGVEQIHQPSVTSLQHNSNCSDFLLRLVILLFIIHSETSLTLMSYLKRPHLFEMRSCPLTYIK